MHKKNLSINIHNEYLHFSAAHFTIFSATDRERLHGHNFAVKAVATSQIQADGLAFDYNELKRELASICDSLDEYTLIAENSKHLTIREKSNYYSVLFNDQEMLLLQCDTLLLPVANITLEELGNYIIEQLRLSGLFERVCIENLEVDVSSGSGQSVTSFYSKGKGKGKGEGKGNSNE